MNRQKNRLVSQAGLVSGLVSLSPMALAFLMGYNVEVLFSIMDKFIEVISKWMPDAQKSSATKEKAAK
ncbi:MAG: hypothetical protein B6245_09840 [Desulfobacteraceae bacterium 4572_88]|nr:MAG: hypothetical protein B6245_09840 [Desulfobacteraceae bacterium 4572_88]